MIIAEQYEEVEFARTTHEVFNSLNIARASPTDIVTRTADILGAPLVLEDLNRPVVAFDAAGESTARLLGHWSERSRGHDATGPDGSWSVVEVGVGPERWGRLVLPATTASPRRARMVLERAAQSLQLHRMIQAERDALIAHALGGLLDDLVAGRINDEADAEARAAALGLAAGAAYVPLVVRVSTRDDGDALARSEIDRHLLAATRQAVSDAGYTAIVSTRREGTVAALMSVPAPTDTDAALGSVRSALEDRLSAQPGASDWAAGTASAASRLVDAAVNLAEAEHVAEVGMTMPESRRIYRSTDVRLRGLVSLLRDDHRIQAFAESELGTLLSHDIHTGDDLLPLLRTYPECACSKTDTAHTTGLSHPTLYSRLHTIERILGVSLTSAESRTALHVATMIIDNERYVPAASRRAAPAGSHASLRG